MPTVVKLVGEGRAVSRVLHLLTDAEAQFMATAPRPARAARGEITPDTHVELIELFVNLGSSIVGGVIVGVVQRGVVERLIADCDKEGVDLSDLSEASDEDDRRSASEVRRSEPPTAMPPSEHPPETDLHE